MARKELSEASWLLGEAIVTDRISTAIGKFGRMSARVSAKPVSVHTHKELSVVFHAGGAELQMVVDDIRCPLRPGDMLMLNPWRPHERITISDRPSFLVVLLIDPRWIESRSAVSAIVPTVIPQFVKSLGEMTPQLRAMVEEASGLMFGQPPDYAVRLQQRITELVDAILNGYCMQQQADGLPLVVPPIDFRVRRAFDHLRRCAIPGIKIETLAAGSGMSRSHFFRQFKRCIGVSPQHVIDEERVAYAIRALSTPGIRLSELSDELGFSAPAHFTRFFVQHLGCTPSEFRRNIVIV